ncbi:MAG: hypothetical protein N2045_02690 [Fimbriimonadales bacterium]|nr:hypothetical protein [Fimbriimonadales bacterium]
MRQSDAPYIRQLYEGHYQNRWKLQYGMNNYKQPRARAGNELFISNYPIVPARSQQLTLVIERAGASYQSAGCDS